MTSLPRPAASDTLGTTGVFLDQVLDAYADLIEANEAALAGKQPLDADLTAIAALTTTSFGRALLALADAAALRTAGGLGTAATSDTGYTANKIPVLTATPGTPDGTKFLRDDGTWAAASSGTSFAPTSAAVTATENTTSDTFTDLSTPGPAVTVTTGASVLVVLSAGMQNPAAGGGAYMGVAVSGASTVAASTGDALTHISDSADGVGQENASLVFPITGLTPGSNTFTAKFRRAGATGTATFFARRITVIPF